MRCSLGLVVAALSRHSAFALKTDYSGDCHTGCKLPLQTEHWSNMSWSDCLDWFYKGCPQTWPGGPTQNHPECWPGANAVSYAENDTDLGSLCRVWSCDPDHDYDGNPAFTCVYNPGGVLPNSSMPDSKSFWPPLNNVCLKNVGALDDLNGVMTPDQASEVCVQYLSEDGKTNCAGFWSDQLAPEPTTTPSAKSAPCNLGVETVKEGSEWRVTGLTGECYLRSQGDPTNDALGGCGYDGDDSQCCLHQPDAKAGTCEAANVYKKCGHITIGTDNTYQFQTCGGDVSIIGKTAHMDALYNSANGYVTCAAEIGCEMNIHKNRFTYYFNSEFVPTKSKADCGQGDSALLRFNANAPNLPVAVQMAYHYMQAQATGDFYDGGGYKWENNIDYGTAWKNCMEDDQCQTFDFQCPPVDGSDDHTCLKCDNDLNTDPNQKCVSKFPGVGVNFSYSTFSYTKNILELPTMAVYRKAHKVPCCPQDSAPAVIMT